MRLLICAFALAAGCSHPVHRPDNSDLLTGGGEADMAAPPQCQGLGCFQVRCDNGGATTVSGVVHAPNGVDPVYDALVYVPSMGLPEFPPTVQCEVCSEPIGGAPLVSVETKVDGSFTLTDVPATSGVPIVIQKGRFRRTIMLDVQQCTDNPLTVEQARLPKNQQEGDLPHFAVGVSDFDQIECVLHAIGIDQSEFTKPSGNGAIHLYANSDQIQGETTLHQLLLDPKKMAAYNLIFIGCAIPTFKDLGDTAKVTQNLHDYVNTGGRLYVTDYSYDYNEQIPQFAPYIYYSGGGDMVMPQPAGAAEGKWFGQTFSATVGDPTLAAWLKLVNKSPNGKVDIEAAYALAESVATDQKTYPSTTWVHGAVQGLDAKDRPHTVTFDYNMCGKVLWSAYHTREPGGAGDWGSFPNYCLSNPADPSTMIAQEKILEFLIFEISACVNMIG